MSSSSNPRPTFPNVPPPEGSRQGSPYTRFIPREELGEFSAWNPERLGGAGQPQAQPTASAPPDSPDHQTRLAEARQAGYQDGYRDGLVALEGFKQSFAAQMSAQVGKLIDSLETQFDALEAQLAEAVVHTALRLARQVVRSELGTRPELVAQVAAEAVQAVLHSARHLTVHAHPADVELIKQGAAEPLSARQARVVASDRISRGGCRVESDLGSVQAGIETRWAQAAASFGSDLPLQAQAGDADGERAE